MRSSRISRISRVSESAGRKMVSVIETQAPEKHIGVRSPRCLGPSSPFAYLKEPDDMNILPLDTKSGKFCTVAVQNSTYNTKRRTLAATLQAISMDLEHVTFLFQEITPQAPIKIVKDEKDIAKESRLQILEAVLGWLNAANFDLVWATSAIDDTDLDNYYDKVQSQLRDSIRSIDRLRAIQNQLMVKFNEYFRTLVLMPSDAFQDLTSSAIFHAIDPLDAGESSVYPKLPVSRTESGIDFSALGADVIDLLKQERTKTAETYEAKLNSMRTALSSQSMLIKQLTVNLKGTNMYVAPKGWESSDEADTEALISKKAKLKKKHHGAHNEDGEESSATDESRAASEVSAKDLKTNKELLSLQKTLRTCQVDSSRLLQTNRTLLETKKELTTSNAHKDKVIGELKARLLESQYADKPKLDKLVVATPKPTREIQPPGKLERPASPRSRFIYIDSAVGGEHPPSAGSSTPEPPVPMMELLTQKRLYTDDDDDDDALESGAGRAATKGKSSGDVRDSKMRDKDKKVKRISSDFEKVRIDDRGQVDAEKTRGSADKTERQMEGTDEEKMAGDGSAVTGAGGRVVSGLNVHGVVGGKGRDARGKGGRTSDAASAGGVDAAVARERVGVPRLGHKREVKGAEDGAAGKAREGSSSSGRKTSVDDHLQEAGQLYDQSGDAMVRLDRDAKRSDIVSSEVSLTDTSAQRGLSPGTDQADLMIGGIRVRPMSGAEKESEKQRMGSALSVGRGSVVSLPLERDGTERGDLSNVASGVSKYSQDRSRARDEDSRAHVRYGTPDQNFVSGVDGKSPVFGAVGGKGMPEGKGPVFGAVGGKGMPEGKGPVFGAVGGKGMPEGKGPVFGAVGGKGMPEGKGPVFGAVSRKGMPEGKGPTSGAVDWKGMPDMGANFGYPSTVRLGSVGQDTSGFEYNLGAFMPQQMGQRLAWMNSEKEGVVPFAEELPAGLRVIGATAVHADTGKGITSTFPLIQPLGDWTGMARVLRSYAVNLNDPNTFERQLDFIKHSGTMDGLREAMRLLAPHLKLLGDNEEQGESVNVLLDVMRTLQRRHVEMITEEFQPAIGSGTTDAKQRKLLTFDSDKRQDICSARARQRAQSTQGLARGLVHLKPLIGHEANALSPCPPYLPAGYMEPLLQKIMRNTFPSQNGQRVEQVTCPRRTKLRSGNQHLMVDNLLKTIDKLTRVSDLVISGL